MPTHTPTAGPWHIGSEHNDDDGYRYDTTGWRFFVGDNRERIDRIDYHIATGIQNLGDAQLIAAAPEMLEALEAIVSSWESEWESHQTKQAREAIAKAKGD